eukprot:TRINITY_DN112523_c0_g1_i1.p1 TRINITY_DN112523_c0_g1~~TRINITY_DN112523_c0_g1_i1.p1  ORF type:complete len:237 (+),score=65.09 TRINITY_DN112523_c0_g1_i1:35-745(+)
MKFFVFAVCVAVAAAFNPTQLAMGSASAMTCRCSIQYSNTSATCGSAMSMTDDLTYGVCTTDTSSTGTTSWKLSLDCSSFMFWNSANCQGTPTKTAKNDGTTCTGLQATTSIKMNCATNTAHTTGIPKSKLCKCLVSGFTDTDTCTKAAPGGTATEWIPKSVCMEGDKNAATKQWYKMSPDCNMIGVYSDGACTTKVSSMQNGVCMKGVKLMCGMSGAVKNTVVATLLAVVAVMFW